MDKIERVVGWLKRGKEMKRGRRLRPRLGDELDGVVITAAHEWPQGLEDLPDWLRHTKKDGPPVRTPREIAVLQT